MVNLPPFFLFNPSFLDAVDVILRVDDDKIVARSSSSLMSISSHPCTMILCFLSCLWIIFFPIALCMRKEVKNALIAEFPMQSTEDTFYYRNAPLLADVVLHRRQDVIAEAI